MNSIIQNSSSSLLPIYSNSIPPGGTAIVYISTTTNVGQLVTIRDMDGTLSTPQRILVSTVTGVRITSGETSIALQQGFAYLTLRSISTNAWTIIDESAFRNPAGSYDIQGVSYNSMFVTDQAVLKGTISTTGPVITTSMILQQRLGVNETLYASSLAVNNYPRFLSVITDGNSLDITGNATISGSLSQSSIVVSGPVIVSTATVQTMSTIGNTTIRGNYSVQGPVTVNGTLSTGYAVTVQGTTTSAGPVIFQDGIRMNRQLNVSSVTVGNTLQTTSISTNSVGFSNTNIYVSRSDIPIIDSTYTGPTNPVVFTSGPQGAVTTVTDGIAASTFVTPLLTVSTLISSATIGLVQFNSAQIQNSAGSIRISSLLAQNITLSNALLGPGGSQLQEINSAQVQANTVINDYQTIVGSTISVANTYATTLSVGSINTSSLDLGGNSMRTNSATIDSLFITSGSINPTLSSIIAPNATIIASQITTSSISAAAALMSNAILNPQTIRSQTASTFGFSTSLVTFSTAFTPSARASSVTTSSLVGNVFQLGNPISYTNGMPCTTTSTISGLTSNTKYEYIQGIGTTYEPLQIRASNDRTVNIFLGGFSPLSTAYINANMTYRNDGNATGVAGLRTVNALGSNTIISFNANPIVSFQKFTLSNFPVEQGIATSTATFYLTGPNTLVPPSTIIAPLPVVAGGSGTYTTAYDPTGTLASFTGYTTPFTTAMKAVTCTGAYWVAGGSGGSNTLAYSYTGSNWFGLGSTIFTGTNAIAWNGSLWLAAGAGTNTLAYSYNGIAWKGLGSTIFTTAGNGLSWNGVRWVAVGQGTNSIAYSDTGLTWTGNGISTFANAGYGVAWGSNTWVAVGGTGVTQIATSLDGASWTADSTTFTNTSSYGYCVAWNGSQWLAGGDSNIVYSAGPSGWTRVGISSIMTPVRAATWADGKWIIGGTRVTDPLATSATAATWNGITGTSLFTTVFSVSNRAPLSNDVSGGDFIAGGGGTAAQAYSLTGFRWTSLSPALFSRINAIAYGFNQWVAVGAGTNTIAFSADGINWTGAGATILAEGRGIAWNGFQWIAVGDATTDAIAYSYNGSTWTGVTGTTLAASFRCVAWDYTNWHVYGADTGTNTIATSPDGITWTGQGAGTAPSECVAWNGSLWVGGAAVAVNGNTLLTSTDGITWTGQGATTFNSTVKGIAWNGLLWAAAGGTNNTFATSPNGTTWTPRTTTLTSGSSIVWTGKRFVAGTNATTTATSAFSVIVGGGTSRIVYSTNGISWSAATNASTFFGTGRGFGIAWNGSIWVAVGGAGTYGVDGTVYYSSDGINWTLSTSGSSLSKNLIYFVAWGGGVWVAGGSGLQTDNNRVIYSSDGINWSASTSGNTIFTTMYDAVWNGTYFVGVGQGPSNNHTAYSYDGNTWVSSTSLSSILVSALGVAFNGTIYITVGVSTNPAPRAAYSYDGITWYPAANMTALTGGGNLYSVATNGQRFVAVMRDGTNRVIYSDDGINWSASANSNSIFTANMWGVAWNGTYFIATSSSSSPASGYSTDGSTWTASANPAGINTTGRVASRSVLPLLTTNIATSPDGTTWTSGTASLSTPKIAARLSLPYGSAPTSVMLALGSNSANPLAITTDGTIWQTITTSLQPTSAVWSGSYWILGNGATPSLQILDAGLNLSTPTLDTTYPLASTEAVAALGIGISTTTVTTLAVGQGATIYDTFCVAVGSYNTAYSADGITWTQATNASNPVAAAWNGTLWVSAGPSGITYSSDGITWTVSSSGSSFGGLNAVAWGGGKWLAAGNGAFSIIYSTDGINWTGSASSSTIFTAAGWALAWNGTIWVAGGNGTNSLAYSSDGITWTASANGNSIFSTLCHSIAWNGTKWVAGGRSGYALAYSSNGINWTGAVLENVLVNEPHVGTNGTIFVAGGYGSTANIVYSLDGITWTASANGNSIFNFSGQKPAWNGFQWVMAGGGTSYSIATSLDGITWTGRTSGFSIFSPYGATYVAARNDYPTVSGIRVGLAYSTDSGLTWYGGISSNSPNYFFNTKGNDVAYGGTQWVSMGQDTATTGIRYSINGLNWSTPTTATGRGFSIGRGVAYYKDLWVGVGTGSTSNDTLGYSADGATWTYLSNAIFSVAGYGVAYGSNGWVAAGQGTNSLAYSADGSNWTGLGTTIFSTRGRRVAWNGRYYVAVGEGTNTLAYSANGSNWTGLGTTTFNTVGYGIAARTLLPAALPIPRTTTIDEPKTFIWSLTGIVLISQTSVQKPSYGTVGWNARAASTGSFSANAYLSYSMSQTNADLMVGLSENPTSTTSYTALNYAFNTTSTGALQIYELGSLVALAGTYTTADTLKIIYDGVTVRYFKNATLLRSVSRTPGAGLYLSSSFNTVGGTINAVDFHALYQLTTVQPALSTSGYSVSQTYGTDVLQFAPFYTTLTSNLLQSEWLVYVTLDGNVTSPTTSFSANICINETTYFSTNVISPRYSTITSTYTLSFAVPNTIVISSAALLSFQFNATRPTGNTFLYTNWSNATQERSSMAIQTSYNTSAFDYLQFFHTSYNTGLQTSELDFTINATSTLSTTYLNSNVSMEMNLSYLSWNTTLNGITIENRFNDIATRSLTYTGSIYNASDPRLKEDIVAADTAQLYTTIHDLPLYNYRLTERYRGHFRIEDYKHLGVLATEVKSALPGASRTAEAPYDELPDFLTVDRGQLKFAHLGATQALIERVSCLKALIAAAAARVPAAAGAAHLIVSKSGDLPPLPALRA
jgi:hypothetical protein